MKLSPHSQVNLKSGFFFDKQELNRTTTINAVYDRFTETGRMQGEGVGELEFIVPINSNSEIRLRRVKYATRVKFAHRASEIRPLGVPTRRRRVVEETLRVSISIIMDKTEGFAP